MKKLIRSLGRALARVFRREGRRDRLSPEADQDAMTYQQRSGL